MKNWAAVAEAINTRLEQLGMLQSELALRSRVSTATIREIQKAVPKKRSPRTLADLSEALELPPSHLEDLANGKSTPTSGSRIDRLEAELSELRQRVERLEGSDDSS